MSWAIAVIVITTRKKSKASSAQPRKPARRAARWSEAGFMAPNVGTGDDLAKMTTSDYHVTMSDKADKPVRVAELKARLSEYLGRVGKGDGMTLYDRDQPSALVVASAAPAGRVVVVEPLR